MALSKRDGHKLLSAYYHMISAFDGEYYRGSWGYAHCGAPDANLESYILTWVIPEIRALIIKHKVIDDTNRLITSYKPYKETPVKNHYRIDTAIVCPVCDAVISGKHCPNGCTFEMGEC